MKTNVIKEDKNELEIEIDNVTIAAILRIETKGKSPKKALEDAVSLIMKEADKLVSEVKKA